MEDNDKIVTLTEQGDMGLGARELTDEEKRILENLKKQNSWCRVNLVKLFPIALWCYGNFILVN